MIAKEWLLFLSDLSRGNTAKKHFLAGTTVKVPMNSLKSFLNNEQIDCNIIIDDFDCNLTNTILNSNFCEDIINSNIVNIELKGNIND